MNKKLLFLFLFFVSNLIYAANIEVRPTKLFISKQNKVTTLHVTNLSDTETLLQVSKYKWGQKNNSYALDNTNDLISSPAMFTLAPKQTQIIRLGVRNFKESNEEQPYRIILKEVHPQKVKDSMGLKIKLQISIPLFISPDSNQAKQTRNSQNISWAIKTNNKILDITAKNYDNFHHTVHNLVFNNKKDSTNIKTFVYLLPKNSFTWKVDTKNIKKGSYTLNAVTDLGDSNVSKDIIIK